MSVRRRTWTTAKGEKASAWVVDYVDGSNDRHIQTFSLKKDADDYQATVKVDVRRGMHVAPSKSITVEQAAEDWINRVEADGNQRGTLVQYRQHANLHIVPRLGRYKLASLTHTTIEKFRDDLLAMAKDPKRKFSWSTARKVLVSFKSMLKVAKFSHVAADVGIPSNSNDKRPVEVGTNIPTTDEIRRLVAAATPGRERSLLLVAATCGLRASELRGLRWRDVDLKGKVLSVTQRADRFVTIGPPKSKAGRRKIPLAPETVAELKAWKLACAPTDDDLVFPTQTGRIAHHQNLYRSVSALQKRAHVIDKATGEPKYALHAFRHFFASWCLNPESAGGREMLPQQVQALLGHSSIKMTMDVYGHLFADKSDPEKLAKATKALLG
jgi:integrase